MDLNQINTLLILLLSLAIFALAVKTLLRSKRPKSHTFHLKVTGLNNEIGIRVTVPKLKASEVDEAFYRLRLSTAQVFRVDVTWVKEITEAEYKEIEVRS